MTAAEIKRWLAAQGYKSVPLEMTREMKDAHWRGTLLRDASGDTKGQATWSSTLLAAPDFAHGLPANDDVSNGRTIYAFLRSLNYQPVPFKLTQIMAQHGERALLGRVVARAQSRWWEAVLRASPMIGTKERSVA